jgi:hypothetical protein
MSEVSSATHPPLNQKNDRFPLEKLYSTSGYIPNLVDENMTDA